MDHRLGHDEAGALRGLYVAHRLRVLFGCAALTLSGAAHAADWTAFIGTYTGPQSKGIYSFRFDSASGKLTGPTLAAESSPLCGERKPERIDQRVRR
jgi:hypothetical protein